MPRRKTNHKKTRRGRGIIDSIKNAYSKVKWKLGDVNDYLKAKKFAKNLITDEVGWHNPVRAIWQGYNINKYLQNSILNGPLQFLASRGYGKKRRYRRKNK